MYHLCKMCICSNFTTREIFTDDRGANEPIYVFEDSRASNVHNPLWAAASLRLQQNDDGKLATVIQKVNVV